MSFGLILFKCGKGGVALGKYFIHVIFKHISLYPVRFMRPNVKACFPQQSTAHLPQIPLKFARYNLTGRFEFFDAFFLLV